jgi:agarase
MYLGARFTKFPLPEHILEQAGDYCDVVTVNVYDLIPDRERMQTWYDRVGRPILIGEHHLPLTSERHLPPHWPRFTHAERNKYYKAYVRNWAKMPFSVGCHWYQFADQHITGRASDGENQTIGLVDIVDQPYQPLVNAIHTSAKNIYEWHDNSK